MTKQTTIDPIRLDLARRLLDIRAMVRNIPSDLTPAEYLQWRMGCSKAQAAELVRILQEEGK